MLTSKIENSREVLNICKGSFKYRLSVTICCCLVVLVFCDPLVLLRTFIRIPGFAELTGFILTCVLLCATLMIGRVNKYGIYIVLFQFLSSIRFIMVGFDWKVIVQGIPQILGIMAVASFGFNKIFIRHLMIALTIAMLLHALAIYFPSDFIQSGLNAQTAYGVDSHLFGRATGFTNAPGSLSGLASVALAMGLVFLCNEKSALWITLVVFSFACGIATGNRSFIMALVATVLTVPFLLWKNRGGRLNSLIVLSVLIAVFSVVMLNTPYYSDRLVSRFAGDILQEDLENRLVGQAGTIEAFKALRVNPILGSMKYSDEAERPLIFNGENFVTTHNGFAYVFGTRGLIFGGVFVIWMVLAGIGLWRASFPSEDSTEKMFVQALFAGFVALHVVSLVESFLEGFLMLMFLTYGLVIRRAQTRKSFLRRG